MRERGEEVERLGGDLDLLGRRERAERAHVVEAVGELDEDHAEVARHREHELADVLGPAELAALEDVVDLGDAVGDGGDLGAELGLDELEREVGVLHGVVEEGRHHARVVEADLLGRDEGDLEGVRDVELARGAAVVAVGPVGHLERAPDPVLVDGREVPAAVLEEHAEPPLVLGLDAEVAELVVEVRRGLDHWGARLGRTAPCPGRRVRAC